MRARTVFFTLILMLTLATPVLAHFGMVIPQTNLMAKPGPLRVEFLFWHPMEGVGMNLAKPKAAGVMLHGEKIDLLPALKEKKSGPHSIWTASYTIKKPGDYQFYMEPQPYWEPAEDCFIIHYTKTVVDALGAEEGWDRPVGLKMEIIPYTRPYGLYAGNSFTGQVLYKGKPLPGAVVEVEYYNKEGKKKAPADAYLTQVVKADEKGIFTWNMPWSGWWGFSSLHTDDIKLKKDGKDKPVEVGGVIWIYAY